MANKRQRKKQEKKRLEQEYRQRQKSGGKGKKKLTYRELREYETNVIIPQREHDEQKRIKAEQRKKSRTARINKKYEQLRGAGIGEEVARRLSNADISQAKIDDFIYGNTKIHDAGENWLSISWHDRTGETDLRGIKSELASMTLQEKIDRIHAMQQAAEADDDGYGTGFAIVMTADSEREIKKLRKAARLRGYDEKIGFNYVDLAASNKFTTEGFVNILYAAMANTGGRNAANVYDKVEEYARQYLPEIHARVFE